jgi:hypothetical protein
VALKVALVVVEDRWLERGPVKKYMLSMVSPISRIFPGSVLTERYESPQMNFTPGYVQQINNKTVLRQERQALKRAAQERRRIYWLHANQVIQGAVSVWTRGRSSNIGQIWKAFLRRRGTKGVTSHTEGEESPQHDSLNNLVLSH